MAFDLANLTAAIRTRLTSDTSAGGLFAVGSELLTSVAWGQVPAGTDFATLPYALLTIDNVGEYEPGFNHDGFKLDFSCLIYGTAENANGMAACYDAASRIFDRLHRWVPAAATGWSAGGPVTWTGTNDISEPPRAYAVDLSFEVDNFRSA